ncbi:hypothetical protein NR800_37510 [Corallococcus interemptor]|uniref:hypothetical protein n=1 Tax=Corallococcus interemptor TaxID=2316720 RepID=UPI0035D41C2B
MTKLVANRILDHHAQMTLQFAVFVASGAGVDDDIAIRMALRKRLMRADILHQSGSEISPGSMRGEIPHSHEHTVSMESRGDAGRAAAAQRTLILNGVGQDQRTATEVGAP